MAFPKGAPRPPGSGRKKGTPNKATQSVREALERAFEASGGIDAFAAWARGNPTEFYKLYAKLLPIQVTGENSNEIVIRTVVTRDPGA